VSSPVKKAATYEDLLKVPEPLVAEILDGELYASPRPALPHTLCASALGALLGGAFQFGRSGPGGWWILDEPELHLAANVLVPDLAGWRRERLPVVPDAAAMDLSPDWVGEILSPSTERMDRAKKLAIYAREAVGHAWLINPIARTLEALRRHGDGWLLIATHAADAVVRVEPFDAIELDLLLLWGGSRSASPR
jgi:Uma2 family endonuclease